MNGNDTPSRHALLIGLSLLALYLIWGSTYLAMRVAIDGFPPFLMAGLRYVLAGALMYAFLRWRGAPRPDRRLVIAIWLGMVFLNERISLTEFAAMPLILGAVVLVMPRRSND